MPADRNRCTKRKSSASSSDVGLHQSKRTKRLSSANNTRKRKYSEVQQSSSTDDDVQRKPKQLVSERPSSTNIHDISKELLVEILCRLPCAKSVFQCMFVSKSWCSLASDPYFIGRFLWLQREKQTLIPGTIINEDGEELVSTDLFARFRSFRFEEKKSFGRLKVVATWNDLVLCKRTYNRDEEQYYICNPRTMQFVSLPPTNEFSWGYGLIQLPVGFICEPFYNKEEDNSDQQEKESSKVIKIDAEYKWKVVRILPPAHNGKLCFEFKIEVFSSETGEWRESLVSCPRGFDYLPILLYPLGACAYNGMLYWINTEDGDLLGLGPLMIKNKRITKSSSNSTALNGDSGYQFHVIKLVRQGYGDNGRGSSYHLQAHHGRLQLVHLVPNDNKGGVTLFVWELEKEELDQMAVQGGGELGQKHRKHYDIMDGVNFHYITRQKYFGFDPNDLDTCFVSVTDFSIHKCNIHTGEVSKMKMGDIEKYLRRRHYKSCMLPWWPTPKPTIRSR